MTDDNGKIAATLTDADIVAGLRSSDPKESGKAMEALFPGEHGGALLIHVGAMSFRVTNTREVDAGRLFNALLYLAQQFGKHVGLTLNWIPEQPDPDAIQIPASRLMR